MFKFIYMTCLCDTLKYDTACLMSYVLWYSVSSYSKVDDFTIDRDNNIYSFSFLILPAIKKKSPPLYYVAMVWIEPFDFQQAQCNSKGGQTETYKRP